jgi:hypothetical protein
MSSTHSILVARSTSTAVLCGVCRRSRSTPSWISPKAEKSKRRVERRDRCAEFGRERGQRRGYYSPSDKGDGQPQKAELLPDLPASPRLSISLIGRTLSSQKSGENYRSSFAKPRSAA